MQQLNVHAQIRPIRIKIQAQSQPIRAKTWLGVSQSEQSTGQKSANQRKLRDRRQPIRAMYRLESANQSKEAPSRVSKSEQCTIRVQTIRAVSFKSSPAQCRGNAEKSLIEQYT